MLGGWVGELFGPTAAQGLVKLDDGEKLVELGLGQRILGREKLLLGFQDFVVTGFARHVALGGNRDRFLVAADLRPDCAFTSPSSVPIQSW